MNDDQQAMDVYSGVRWSAVARYSVQALDVVISLVVARLVAPEAYGLLGMAVVITGFLQTLQTLGLGSAIIQRKEINPALLSSLFFLNLGFCCLLAAGLICGAPLVSWIYRDARVGPVVAVLSISFLVSAPGLVPSSLLNRRMAFQRLAAVDIFTCIVRGTTAITLAAAGWGVWALVFSSIAGQTTQMALLYATAGWWPQAIFRWSEVRSVLNFSANLTGFSIFMYFAVNADKFIIGAFLGAKPLGYYGLAYRILMLPRETITQVVTRVLFPAFSQRQEDDSLLTSACLRTGGAIALFTFPMMAGLMVVARPFVHLVLGDKWLPAVPLIYILAPLGALTSVSTAGNVLYYAKGRTDWLFRWSVVTGTLRILGFLVALPWGLSGIAMAYTVVCGALWVPSMYVPFRLVEGLRVRDYVKALVPPALCSATMALIVMLFRTAMERAGLGAASVLASCVPLGIASYVVIMVCIRPPALDVLLRLLPRCAPSSTPSADVRQVPGP